MIQKIKDYLLLVGLLALSILAFVVQRRGEKIRDLQDNLITKDLKKEVDRSLEKMEKGERTYEDAVNKYHTKRDRYNKLFWSKRKPD